MTRTTSSPCEGGSRVAPSTATTTTLRPATTPPPSATTARSSTKRPSTTKTPLRTRPAGRPGTQIETQTETHTPDPPLPPTETPQPISRTPQLTPRIPQFTPGSPPLRACLAMLPTAGLRGTRKASGTAEASLRTTISTGDDVYTLLPLHPILPPAIMLIVIKNQRTCLSLPSRRTWSAPAPSA
jgi:hypothetical protein